MLIALLVAILAAVVFGGLLVAEHRNLSHLRGWVLEHSSGRVVVVTRPDATEADLFETGEALLAGRRHVHTGGM